MIIYSLNVTMLLSSSMAFSMPGGQIVMAKRIISGQEMTLAADRITRVDVVWTGRVLMRISSATVTVIFL